MKINIYRVILAVVTLMWAEAAAAQVLVTFDLGRDRETVRLALPVVEPHKVFTLAGPDRLVVDVPSVPGNPSVAVPSSYKGKLIKGLRLGRFNAKTSRFVFDLGLPVRVLNVDVKAGKLPQLSIEIAENPDAAEKPVAKKPAVKEKPMIVIDPGHGGVDPGTLGPRSRLKEKDLTLQYAKALQASLLATGRYRVKLTRETDRFIMLRKRIEIARKAGGDLFVSIHADSAPSRAARGLSVYTLSEKASDKEAELLAAQENKVDVLSGLDLSEESKDVADILISLAQRETKNNSATLATLLVRSMRKRVALLENPHRFAGFAVLKAPDMPSVLIEAGFLSHASEEKLLKTKLHREKVVQGIIDGIDDYFRQKQDNEGGG